MNRCTYEQRKEGTEEREQVLSKFMVEMCA